MGRQRGARVATAGSSLNRIHPSDLVRNHSYHAQLLGEEFLRRIEAMSELDRLPVVTLRDNAYPPKKEWQEQQEQWRAAIDYAIKLLCT